MSPTSSDPPPFQSFGASRGFGFSFSRPHDVRGVALQSDGQIMVVGLFDTLAKRYVSRPGGYSRVLRISTRVGDSAEMAVITLVEEEIRTKTKKPAPKAKVKAEKKVDITQAEPKGSATESKAADASASAAPENPPA